MLAFDIETTGLDSKTCRITVACVFDPDRQIRRAFNFLRDPAKYEDEKKEFLQCLDDAPALCSFNGVRFDIPFIAAQFGVPAEQQGRWMLKLFDYFEICRLCYRSSCSLDNLLRHNGYTELKTSSGLQAVQWAEEGQWDMLEEYCMQDTVLTHKISSEHRQGSCIVHLPLTGWGKGVTCRSTLDDVDDENVREQSHRWLELSQSSRAC